MGDMSCPLGGERGGDSITDILREFSVSTKGSGDNGGRILIFRSISRVRYILLDDFAVFVMKDELKMIQS